MCRPPHFEHRGTLRRTSADTLPLRLGLLGPPPGFLPRTAPRTAVLAAPMRRQGSPGKLSSLEGSHRVRGVSSPSSSTPALRPLSSRRSSRGPALVQEVPQRPPQLPGSFGRRALERLAHARRRLAPLGVPARDLGEERLRGVRAHEARVVRVDGDGDGGMERASVVVMRWQQLSQLVCAPLHTCAWCLGVALLPYHDCHGLTALVDPGRMPCSTGMVTVSRRIVALG